MKYRLESKQRCEGSSYRSCSQPMESKKSLKEIRLREWSAVKFLACLKAAKDWINSEAYEDIAKHRKLGRPITDSLLKVSANGEEIHAR